MLPLHNKIEIPISQIEDALREGAVPGFYGTIRVAVRLNPTAALEIDLLKEKVSITDGGKQRETINIIPAFNDRLARVQMKLAELRERFFLYCPVTQVEAIFEDGELTTFSVTEVENPAMEPRMRFAAVQSPKGG